MLSQGRLLAVLFLGHFDVQRPWRDMELQLADYLCNHLSIILDRIRIYEEVAYQREMDHADKMQVMQTLSANIAHEMRTPLSGIRASISGIENYLPLLLSSYRQMVQQEQGATRERIRDQHLQTLQVTPERIRLMIDQANTVIDMLLMNLRNSALDRLERCDAARCVEQAIERYPFKSGERAKVHLQLDNNFQFMGVEVLMIYILFNLLKNALYSLRSAQKGEIFIHLEKGKKSHTIFFRDTGEGMLPEVSAQIFESFFTTKADGTGVGLTFCRRTLRHFGGDIECDSVYGEYSEFRLQLPRES